MSLLTDSRRQALRSASTWYALLNAERVSEQQRARWQAWYQQDDDNQWAWQQVENLRHEMSAIPGNIASRALRDSQVTRRHVLKGLVVLIATGAGWQLWHSDTRVGLQADYRAAKGSVRHERLADGSQLALNTESAVNVRFDGDQRLIQLLYGEIAITTANDPHQRPFRVHTREGQLTALGTRFSVVQEQGFTRLDVQEHAVEVVLASDPAAKRVVNQGESLRFSDRHFDAVMPLSDEANSWTQGVLSFSDKPLGEVVAVLSRYRPGVLRCDPLITGLRLSGTFPLKDTDAVLRVISQTLPVKIQSITRYWVTLAPV